MADSGRTRAELEQRVWYRFVKVLFVFTYVAVLALVELVVFAAARPSVYVNNEATLIRCANGKSYNVSASGIYLSSDSVYSTDDRRIRVLCATGKAGGGLGIEGISEKNYAIQFAYNREGNWGKAAGWLLGGFVGVHLTFALIKRAFFYVALGKFWA